MNYPKHIEQKLGFDQILDSVKNKCLTESGKQMIDALTFLTSPEAIEKELNLVDEMREILVLDYHFPFAYFDHLSRVFEKLQIIDGRIDLDEIVALKKFLDVLRSVVQFFNDDKTKKFVELRSLVGQVMVHKYVSDQINGVVNAKGEVKDNASIELSNIRRSIRSRKNDVSKQINSVYAKIKQSGWLDADLSVTMVNGRIVVPIDASHKRKIPGMIHDVSATGKTAYIEPSEVLHLNNEIVELEYREKQEIERILKELCQQIQPYTPDLIQAFQFLSVIDMYRAKAQYAITLRAIRPAVNPHPQIGLNNARHPLLYISFLKEHKEVVPLNIRLENTDRIALISGPNAGGKSVALKTVGLLQLMLQYGFLIPVGGGSEMGVFDQLFIDIGDDQSIDNDLSTYSSHLLNMKHFLRNSNAKTLILIDEFGTGTEPAIGGAIAESVLEKLNETGTFGVITTHYSNLKHLAASRAGLVNAAMMFDNQKLQALFQLELSQAGSSFAFEIARKIGLPEDVLKSASEKVGQKQVDFDKHLREVLRDKKYWNEKRNQIRIKEKQMDELIVQLTADADAIKTLKKQTLSSAKKEAEALLKTVNKKVENTIMAIKSVQAEKEQTKAIRQEFEQFKKEIIEQKSKEQEDQILRKIEKLKNRKKKTKGQQIAPLKEEPKVLEVGSKVKIKFTESFGEVLEWSGKNALLAVGDMRMNVALSKLEIVSNQDYKKNNPAKHRSGNALFTNSMEKKLHFTARLDIRGKRVEEAMEMLAIFMDDAIATDTRELKILHGTGTGALKMASRDYLKSLPFVSSVKDELLEMGGAGVTVVHVS